MDSRVVLLVLIASCGGGAGAPSTPAPLVHRFEHADEWAKRFDDPSRDAWQRPSDVIAAMKITPGMTVADIGAGTGYFEPWLSRAVGSSGVVLALDVEPDMVRYMKERAERERWGNVKPAQVATDDPELPAGKVDRILIVDTWHHIPARDAYAKKLRAALAPRGTVTVVDYTKESTHGPPPEHRLTAEQVIGELRGAGLRAAVVPAGLPEQYVVTAALSVAAVAATGEIGTTGKDGGSDGGKAVELAGGDGGE